MIYATNVEDAKFFCEKTSYIPTFNFRGMKDCTPLGEIKAMVGFDFWTPNSVQIHVWIGNPKNLSRRFIREVFTHLFVTCKKKLVVGVTPSDNSAALELNRRIGFIEKYRISEGWDDGVDMVLQEIRIENCRWVRRH